MYLPDHKQVVGSRIQDLYGQEMMKWGGKGINEGEWESGSPQNFSQIKERLWGTTGERTGKKL